MKKRTCLILLCAILIALLSGAALYAQDIISADTDTSSVNTPAPLSQDDLLKLVAPIALYPDTVVADILTASSNPLDVVEAARYLQQQGGSVTAPPDNDWDPGLQALLAFPAVLNQMNTDLDWTQKLGIAFMNQKSDLMNAIQLARNNAINSGALVSNDKQSVAVNGQIVTIAPTNPQVIYLPSYQPTIVYNTAPQNNNDNAAADLLSFGAGFAAGSWAAPWGCNWGGGIINVNQYNYYHNYPNYNNHNFNWHGDNIPNNWQPGNRGMLYQHNNPHYGPTNINTGGNKFNGFNKPDNRPSAPGLLNDHPGAKPDFGGNNLFGGGFNKGDDTHAFSNRGSSSRFGGGFGGFHGGGGGFHGGGRR